MGITTESEVKHEMSYAKGKQMDNMSLFEFHPDNVPEMILAQKPTSNPIAMIFKMMAEGDDYYEQHQE